MIMDAQENNDLKHEIWLYSSREALIRYKCTSYDYKIYSNFFILKKKYNHIFYCRIFIILFRNRLIPLMNNRKKNV